MRIELGERESLFIHLTLVPYIGAAGELKTKPTQHSVKELRSIGIQPDVLLCRSERPLPDGERRKIALFTNVPERAVINCIDADSIYRIPRMLHAQGLDDLVVERFGLEAAASDLSEWDAVVDGLGGGLRGSPRRARAGAGRPYSRGLPHAARDGGILGRSEQPVFQVRGLRPGQALRVLLQLGLAFGAGDRGRERPNRDATWRRNSARSCSRPALFDAILHALLAAFLKATASAIRPPGGSLIAGAGIGETSATWARGYDVPPSPAVWGSSK